MNILKNLFLLNKKSEKNKDLISGLVDQYIEISKLVKEARMQQNLTVKELSYISKIPERIINSISIKQIFVFKNCLLKGLISLGILNEYFEKFLFI